MSGSKFVMQSGFNGSSRILLNPDGDGKVGIGTPSPSTLLQLSGTGGNSSGLSFVNGSGEFVRQYFVNENADSSFVITYDGTGGAEITLQDDGDLILNGSNGDNVGIGTTTPTSKLSVSGSIDFANNSGSLSYFEDPDADTGTTLLAQVSSTNYQGLFYDYVIIRTAGIGRRAGTVTAITDGTNVEFSDVSTVSIGDTSGLTFNVTAGLGVMVLSFISDENNVNVKGLLRLV